MKIIKRITKVKSFLKKDWHKRNPTDKELTKEYLIVTTHIQKYDDSPDYSYNNEMQINLYKERGKISLSIWDDNDSSYLDAKELKEFINILRKEKLL